MGSGDVVIVLAREAIKEATRDGAPTIDLIDGEQLVVPLRSW